MSEFSVFYIWIKSISYFLLLKIRYHLLASLIHAHIYKRETLRLYVFKLYIMDNQSASSVYLSGDTYFLEEHSNVAFARTTYIYI